MSEAKKGSGITRTPFSDAVAKPKGGLGSPAPNKGNPNNSKGK